MFTSGFERVVFVVGCGFPVPKGARDLLIGMDEFYGE
jgi:hypothetical protein